MKVRDILEQLAYGELANTSIGGDDLSPITSPDKYRQIIPAINSALGALYSRFELGFNNILLEQVGHIGTYHLKTRYAESSGSAEEFKYLKDSLSNPFEEDVIRIDRIIDSCSDPVFINNESFCTSVFLPTYDSIEFPTVEDGAVLNVIYQAAHKRLDIEGVSALEQEVTIPEHFMEALLAYVAHRIYKNRKSLAGESQSNNYYSIYQSECARLENKTPVNLISKEIATIDSGWV